MPDDNTNIGEGNGNDDDNPLDYAHSVSFKLPGYGLSNPRVWFSQVEAFFRFRRITSQATMYSYVVTQLPTDVACEVVDLLDPMPAVNPYDTLKAALLKRTTASDEARLQQLLSGVELGDRTPSQLLRHMRSLVGNNKLDDSILRQLWVNCLPANTKAILSVQAPDTPLEKLAEVADKVHECFFSSSVHNVSNVPTSSTTKEDINAIQTQLKSMQLQMNAFMERRSSSRSRSRSRRRDSPLPNRNDGVCYYHRRFKEKARKCTHPCTFHPNNVPQGNEMAKQ